MATLYRNQEWTEEEDKTFEYALAIFDEDTPDRWENVAAVLPRKTVLDVIMHYKKLEKDMCGVEAGLVPPFLDSSFSPEKAVGDHSDGGSKKRSATKSSSENKGKKVVHWTEDEHKLFLLGLQECGKGAWRNIARKFVVSKTPTQVASHAQKYYIRQKLSEGGKDDNKKRSSIHDITLLDIMENTTPIEDKSLPLIQESQIMSSPPQQMKETSIQTVQPEWINRDNNNDQLMVFNPSNYDEMFMLSSQVMPSPQLEKTSIQNLQPGWINCDHNNNQLMVYNPNNDFEVGGAQQKKTSIQNVQHDWISSDNNNDQLMGFNPSNDGMSMLSSQVMPSPLLEKTSIQNVQPEWINVGHNNNQLMVFNPNNDYEVGGAQQKKTSIQNVQPEWISCDYNNDQLMGFNPSNDGMSMISSQDHQVTGAQDLYDIYFHCT